MSKDLRQWFKDHPCLQIRCLEIEADLPKKTLDHFVNGRRELNKDHLTKLTPVLKKYGYGI